MVKTLLRLTWGVSSGGGVGKGRNWIESLRSAESLKLCDLLGPASHQTIEFVLYYNILSNYVLIKRI